MTLQFKEKWYNWGDTFYIHDDNDRRVYRVKSSILLWNQKFEISDMDKNVLVTIKKEPMSLLKPKYYIFINEEQRAAVTRELSVVPKYTIEGLDWQMHGVMLHDYEMLSGGKEVLSFHMESTPWGFRPVLKITEPGNELLALAVVLTISYAMNAKDDDTPAHRL